MLWECLGEPGVCSNCIPPLCCGSVWESLGSVGIRAVNSVDLVELIRLPTPIHGPPLVCVHVAGSLGVTVLLVITD